MGRVMAPFGVKGWMKIQSFSAEPGALPAHSSWWLHLQDGWRECSVQEARVHGAGVVELGSHTPHGTVADACYTRERGVACTIMVADCLPLLFTEHSGDERRPL